MGFIGNMKLSLYVWQNFSPDYTDGMAVAIAPNKITAMKLVADTKISGTFREWGDCDVFPLDEPIAFAVEGGA